MRFVLLLMAAFPFSSFAQSMQERLIFTDNKDSLFLGDDATHAFNKKGDYFFIIKKAPESYYVVTRFDTLGPFRGSSVSFTGTGDMERIYNHYKEDSPYYYKNYRGTKMYGPITGKTDRQFTNFTNERIALTVVRNDSVFFLPGWCITCQKAAGKRYVPGNGRLVHLQSQWPDALLPAA